MKPAERSDRATSLLSPAAHSTSVVPYVLGVALDVITLALILNRNVTRVFD